jgi:hypothetical protein
MKNRLTPDFLLLVESRNLAAVDALERLLESAKQDTRDCAVMALSLRRDRYSAERLVGSFERSSPFDRRGWKSIACRLLPFLLEVLEDPSHKLFRSGLKLVGRCEIVEGFARLVGAAEQVSRPYASQAARILLELSTRLGNEARSGMKNSAREYLTKLLGDSLENFSLHRSQAIVEAFLVSACPNDATLQSILKQDDPKTLNILIRQWKTTQRQESLDLLVQLFGKPFVRRSLIEVLCRDRKDAGLARAIARSTEDGFSTSMASRIQQHGGLACFDEIEKSSSQVSDDDRRQLWIVMAAGKVPLPKLFEGIGSILEKPSLEAQHAVAEMLRRYQAPGCREILKSMAPAMGWDGIEPAESDLESLMEQGLRFRDSLLKLVGCRDSGSGEIRRAIIEFFHDFNLESFLENLDVLNDAAIRCFAEVLPLVDDRWHEVLLPVLKSNSPKVRCRGAIAAGYLPPHPDLRLSLTSLLGDQYEIIQEEAAYAMQKYNASSMPPARMNTSEATLTPVVA